MNCLSVFYYFVGLALKGLRATYRFIEKLSNPFSAIKGQNTVKPLLTENCSSVSYKKKSGCSQQQGWVGEIWLYA